MIDGFLKPKQQIPLLLTLAIVTFFPFSLFFPLTGLLLLAATVTPESLSIIDLIDVVAIFSFHSELLGRKGRKVY